MPFVSEPLDDADERAAPPLQDTGVFGDIPRPIWIAFLAAWALLFGLFIIFFTADGEAALMVVTASFFALMTHRFGGQGFYVLDEPEAALSPSRQLAMIARMHELVQTRSQFIIATHSPILMAYPGAGLYQITSEGLARIEYRQTEHYIISKRFLNDPDTQLARLLSQS